MEAIIPTKIGMPTTLRIGIPGEANAEVITKDLYMTYELYEATVVHIASYKKRLTNLYNRLVKPRTFQDGDMVQTRKGHIR